MFSNRFSFHMSGNGDIARCNSLDARHALGVVMELGLEDVVDVVEVGGDVIKDVKVDAFGATRVTITPWLNLGAKEEKEKDGKEDCEGEEGEYKC
ncbi:hypothetical protein AHAS_Ahas09G0075700 [Arachis hypogaea]